MRTALATKAFLHARGVEVEPDSLTASVRAALDALDVRYRAGAGAEGMSDAEISVVREGGLDPYAGYAKSDPLVDGVVAYVCLVEGGLTTQAAAERLGVSDARIRQRLMERTLLAIRVGRSWLLPAFQFTANGELPGWGEVCRQLPAAVSPVAVERWLSLVSSDLVVGAAEAPVSPRVWLEAGRPAAAVTELLHDLA